MVKKNYFTANQADLIIKGADEPNTVSPAFCIDQANEIIEIYVHVSAMMAEGNSFEGKGLMNKYVVSILEDDKVVAVAKADDMEEPSSLSVLYRGKAEAEYSV